MITELKHDTQNDNMHVSLMGSTVRGGPGTSNFLAEHIRRSSKVSGP